MNISNLKKWSLGFICGAIFCFLISGLSVAILRKGLESSDAAGWMQAIGSLAAILGAFAIAENQHRIGRELDKQRAQDQGKMERDSALLSRARAVRNLVQVATQAQAAARSIIAIKKDALNAYTEENFSGRIDALIAILDGFVRAETDHVAVVAALNISMALAKTQADLNLVGGSMTETLLKKCDERTNDAEVFLINLVNLQATLLDQCRVGGIDIGGGEED